MPCLNEAETLPACVLAAKKGLKNISTVVINNDYGVGFEKVFVESVAKDGGKILIHLQE